MVIQERISQLQRDISTLRSSQEGIAERDTEGTIWLSEGAGALFRILAQIEARAGQVVQDLFSAYQFESPDVAWRRFLQDGGFPRSLNGYMLALVELQHADVATEDSCDENCASDTGDDESNDEEVHRPGHLGLIINTDEYRITRSGFDHSVELSRTGLEIVNHFVDRRAAWVSRVDFEAMRGSLDLSENTTIDPYLSELRPRLRELGIEIKNNRGVGWRLEEIPPDDAAL